MRGSFKKVFAKKDNLLSLITAMLALLIAVLDITGDILPKGSTQEALLLVLGLLAISNIVERETRFEKTNEKIDKLDQRLNTVTKPRFFHVSDLQPLPEYMKGSDELFYTGGHLHSLVHNNTNLFEGWLKDGKSLRFLLQNPENKGLKTLSMPCVNYSPSVYVAQIEDSIKILSDLKRKIPSARIGVRVTNVTPTQSVSILDGHKSGTKLCMLLHLPNGDANSAPFVCMDQYSDGDWFKLFYERYYIFLWSESKVIIKHPDDR